MYRKILVPVDRTGLSQRALDYALNLAAGFEAKITLLTVEEPIHEEVVSEEDGRRIPIWEYEASLEQTRKQDLERLARTQAAPTISFETAVRFGKPSEEIARYAEEAGQGVIVMATRARGGIDRLLRGSVTDEVIHRTHVPVLVVRPVAVEELEPASTA